jgi:hypothetical protein
MRSNRRQERRASVADLVDGCFFAFSGLAAIWLAYLLLRDGVRAGWSALLLLVFWIFFTYLVLPRLHRILTEIYVPGYFIGRARTSDGLLGDPVNLALNGGENQVHAALTGAGWTRADDLDLGAGRRIVTSVLTRRSYPEAPVSPLHLFERQQDFAYQQEVAGNPSKRHHVRFWRCPEGWLLPGGFEADWLAAATFDRRVGLSLFTLQITHKIEENTDVERDFLIGTIREASPQVRLDVIENFSSGYHARNGGGDRIRTDGNLPILGLAEVPAPPDDPSIATDSRDRRPATTTFGAGVALLRALSYAVIAALSVASADGSGILEHTVSRAEMRGFAYSVAALSLLAALVDTVLALAVFRGHNWARLWLMTASSFSAITAFAATVGEDGEPVGYASLPTLSASILVLLALSSRDARQYATRGRSTAPT